MALVFDERSMLDENVFKYERRMKAASRFYSSAGSVLVTYYNQSQNSTTVDRGLRDIDHLYGKSSPIRFNKIRNVPLFEFGQVTPNNTEEQQIEDIITDGEAIMHPGTVVPCQYDCFILNHLQMSALFQVTEVLYDSMKVEGAYKIKYRLYSTSQETIQQVESQCVGTYDVDLNAVGTNTNPIISEKDFIKRKQIALMRNKMIESYKALFYDKTHNCFMGFHPQYRYYLFDMCGNEFMARHSLMNVPNSNDIIMLHTKIHDKQLPLLYNNSIFNWIEIDAPRSLMQKFHYILTDAEGYPDTSFAHWRTTDIKVVWPLGTYQSKCNFQEHSYFDDRQYRALVNDEDVYTEYETLIRKFVNKGNDISIDDLSLSLGNGLLNSNRSIDVYLYTPIIIYIINKVLSFK